MMLKPFKVNDYVQARLVNGIGLEHWGLLNGIYFTLAYMEKIKTFWTLWDMSEVVCIGGWYEAWPGVCEVSFYPTERFLRSPFSAVRIIRKTLKELTLTCRRIQLNCRREDRFMSFAKYLGFHEEGVLHKFGHDGHDHVMMAIVEGVWPK